jgi:hypothetical protein
VSAEEGPDYFIENEKIKYTGEAYTRSEGAVLMFYFKK